MKDIRSFPTRFPPGPPFPRFSVRLPDHTSVLPGLLSPRFSDGAAAPPAGNGRFPFASAVPAFRRPSLVLQIDPSGCPARFPGPPVPPAGLASICRFCLPGSAARARFEALPRNPAHVILPCKTARLPNFPLPSGWGRIPAPTASLPYTIAAVGGGVSVSRRTPSFLPTRFRCASPALEFAAGFTLPRSLPAPASGFCPACRSGLTGEPPLRGILSASPVFPDCVAPWLSRCFHDSSRV